jgi:hypothetical protein
LPAYVAWGLAAAHSPLSGRPSEPEDVTDAMVALLSQATYRITGETIAASGGYRSLTLRELCSA